MVISNFLALCAALPAGSSATFTQESLALLAAELTTSVAPAPSSSTKPKANDDLLTAREAAARLNLKTETLYKAVYKRLFAVRVGSRSIRYSATKIDRYLGKAAL